MGRKRHVKKHPRGSASSPAKQDQKQQQQQNHHGSGHHEDASKRRKRQHQHKPVLQRGGHKRSSASSSSSQRQAQLPQTLPSSHPFPRFTLDLDLPPARRWDHIATAYRQQLLPFFTKYEEICLDLALEALGESPMPTLTTKQEWAHNLVTRMLPSSTSPGQDAQPAFSIYVSYVSLHSL